MICRERGNEMKKTVLLVLAGLLVLVSAARAGDLAEVRKAGVLQFGVSPDRYPFVFYDQNDDLTGIDIKLMEEIAERLDLELEVSEMSSDDLMESLAIGQVDVIGGAFSKTPSRQETVDFTSVYYVAEAVFLARSSRQMPLPDGPEDFSGLKIGVLKNSGFEDWLRSELLDKGFIFKKDIYTYDKMDDAIRALDKGRIDLVMTDFSLYRFRYQDDPDYMMIEYGSVSDSYAFGLRKDSDLKSAVNQQLKAMLRDGTAQEIADSFFSSEEPEDNTVIRWTDKKQASTPTPPPTATLLPTAPMIYPAAPTAVPTATPIPVSAPATCNYTMGYVADVTIPDGQPISAGSPFTKTWRLRNTGNCAWTTAFMFTFVSGSQMGGLNRYLPYTVSPGDTVDISVDLIAPTTPGTYQGYWQIKTPQGYNVGFSVWVTIVVPGAYSYPTEPPYYEVPTSAPSYSYPTATSVFDGPTWIESESKWFATMAAGLPTLTPTPIWKPIKEIHTDVDLDVAKVFATELAKDSGKYLENVDLSDIVIFH